MVNITNGIQTLKVSRGAFDSIFKNMGYTIVENSVESVEKEVEESEEEKESEKSADEIFAEELVEKPISNWSKEEVKRFAEIKGIDISGTSNPKEAKEIIKGYLE